MNSRRAEYQDSGSPEFRLPMFNQKKRWQPAKIQRPSVYWFAVIRLFYRFDLCAWGMCKYAEKLERAISRMNEGVRYKLQHWNYICKLRRLRKPWEAIKTTI